jgi:hypothetical protein
MFAFFFSNASIDVAPGGVALSGGLMDGTNDVHYVKFISSPGEESAA